MAHRKTTVLAVGTALAAAVAGVLAQGTLADLGVQEAAAKQQIVGTLADGYVPWHLAAKPFKAAGAPVRVAMVRTAMAWAKAYTETPAFRADYDRRRAQDAPAPFKPKGPADEQLAKQRAEQKKQIEEMRANIAKMPPEMRKQMEETVKQVEAQFAAQEKDPQMAALMKQGLEMQAVEEKKAYEGRVAAHEKRFPADPKALIARRLREFLATSKDVDFNAKLVPGPGGKMVFANAAYEEKPPEWKLCYRAGRESVEAARTFAAGWLGALE
jgi:hypothetical protein